MLAFVAYVVAGVIFWTAYAAEEPNRVKTIALGLIVLAVGHALASIPYGPRWPNRAP